jgi:lipid A 3-O-deacylase
MRNRFPPFYGLPGFRAERSRLSFMSRRQAVGFWGWVALLIFLPGLGWGGDADLRTRITKGTMEYGLLMGYWQGNNLFRNEPSSNRSALLVLPQLGYVLTDELGQGKLAGNIELLIEPMAAHFFQPFSASAFGGTAGLKYNFLAFGRWMPFWDGGFGVLWTDLAPRIPEQSTPFNFIIQTGPGISYFVSDGTAVTLGIRFHHISNSGIGDRNIGLNAWLFNVGVSFFTP